MDLFDALVSPCLIQLTSEGRISQAATLGSIVPLSIASASLVLRRPTVSHGVKQGVQTQKSILKYF